MYFSLFVVRWYLCDDNEVMQVEGPEGDYGDVYSLLYESSAAEEYYPCSQRVTQKINVISIPIQFYSVIFKVIA
jgi:hypothetical protein